MSTQARKTALVTGAGAGIGHATALKLLRAGWRVGAYDIDTSGLADLHERYDDHVVTGPLDVRDAEAWSAALDSLTAESQGQLNLLVNNAGILQSGLFTEIPLAAQQRTVEVNVIGTLNGCYSAYPYLRVTPDARVINLASASAMYGQPELATYSATKFAVRGLTEALDIEWAHDDITVSALWPLFVATAMTTDMDTASTRSLGIRLTADDVATDVLHLAEAKPGRLRSPHHAVGRQATALMALSSVAPTRVMRLINKRIAG